MVRVWLYSLTCCAVAAILEGVFAGSNVRRQLQEIRMPKFAPPFVVWVAIGLGYYATALVILSRLFTQPPSVLRNTAMALMAMVLFLNALWNLFFFRRREFGQAFVLSLFYSGLSGVLLMLLILLDRATALVFSPYVVYLSYANTFGYWVWRLNQSDHMVSRSEFE